MPRIPNIQFLEQQPSQPNYEFTMPTVLVREPRLLIPNNAPIRAVKMDLRHPIVAMHRPHFIDVYVGELDFSSDQPGHSAGYISNVGPKPKQASANRVAAIRTIAGKGPMGWGYHNRDTTGIPNLVLGSLAMFGICYVDALTATTQPVLSWCVNLNSGGTFEVSNADGTWSNSGIYAPLKQPFTLAYTRKCGNTASIPVGLWLNGVEVFTNTTVQGGNYYHTDFYAKVRGGPNPQYGQVVFLAQIREMTDVPDRRTMFVKELHRDPYQFLIPA